MRALITGITGQDGSYLAEQLVAAGHEVHGVTRKSAGDAPNLTAIASRVTLHEIDLLDAASVCALVERTKPERVFHLAAKSFIGAREAGGAGFNVHATITLLEALAALSPACRFVLAGSAAQRAGALTSPQNELTPPALTTTYGMSKQLAGEAVAFFRQRYAMHGSVAILYNHESPRRPKHFVSRKLATAAAAIARGRASSVEVGDLDAQRDWGWAPDYVDAMARMAECDEPHDLVIATGVAASVRDLAAAAFDVVGLDAAKHLVVREELLRAPDPVTLVGDATKARALLDWQPTKTLREIMRAMVEAELHALDAEDARPR